MTDAQKKKLVTLEGLQEFYNYIIEIIEENEEVVTKAFAQLGVDEQATIEDINNLT